jgi:hypothetical protein
VADDGHFVQLHAELGHAWVLDAIPDDLASADDEDSVASRTG